MRIALVLVLVLVTACGSTTAYRTTRIASTNTTQWLFGAQISGAGTVGVDEGGGKGGNAPLPELAVSARRGLGDRVEAQLNTTLLATALASTGSIELAGKVRLVERGRWSLAVGGGAGYRLSYAGGAEVEDVYVSAPVIGAVELGRHQLVLSLDAGYHRLYASGAQPVGVPFVGDSLGFLWQIGTHWALLPEVGAGYSPTPNFMTDDSRLFHVGIAAVWTR